MKPYEVQLEKTESKTENYFKKILKYFLQTTNCFSANSLSVPMKTKNRQKI